MIVLGLVALFLAAHLVIGLTGAGCPWGIDALRFLPRAASALFALGGLLVVGAGWRLAGRAAAASDRAAPRSSIAIWIASGVAVTVLLAALFVVCRVRAHLLGDGNMYLTVIPLSGPSGPRLVGYEPLSHALVRAIHDAVSGRPDATELAPRLGSWGAGALYVALVFAAAWDLGRDRRGRLVTLGALLTPGFMGLFFGYIETYAFLYPPLLALLWTTVRALEGRGPLWLPAAILGASLPLHFGLLAFVPLLACVPLLRGAPPRAIAGRAAVAVALAGALCLGLLAWLDIPFHRYIEGARGDNLLAIAGPLTLHQAYHLFSPRHFWDLANALALAAPAALLALPLARPRRAPRDATALLLLIAGALPLVMIFLLNPEIGAFRDWDLMTLPALPLTLWAARRIAVADGSSRRAGLAIAIFGAAALHTASWVAVNARLESSERRFTTNLERSGTSVHARAYGWETLGQHLRDRRHDPLRAREAYDRAIAADPHNTRYWNLAAALYAETGDGATAARYLSRAIELQPDAHPENYNNLGALYMDQGKLEPAAAQFRRALALEPRYLGARRNLGDALSRLGRHAEAARELQTALEQQPGSPDLLTDLAAAKLRAGRPGEARAALEQAVATAPASFRAWALLGDAREAAGDEPGAIASWREAVRLRPESVEAWMKLAAAYEQRADASGLAESLRAILRLQPGHPLAARMRERLEQLGAK